MKWIVKRRDLETGAVDYAAIQGGYITWTPHKADATRGEQEDTELAAWKFDCVRIMYDFEAIPEL